MGQKIAGIKVTGSFQKLHPLFPLSGQCQLRLLVKLEGIHRDLFRCDQIITARLEHHGGVLQAYLLQNTPQVADGHLQVVGRIGHTILVAKQLVYQDVLRHALLPMEQQHLQHLHGARDVISF